MVLANNEAVSTARTADDLIERLTAPVGKNWFALIAELIWNGRDAGAKNITVQFVQADKNTMDVRVIDDGVGMTGRRRTAFVSLGVSDWDTGGKRTVRGKNGTGRLGCFHHGNRLSAETRPAKSDVYAISFDRDGFAKILKEGQAIWQVRPFAQGGTIKSTGTVVTIHGVDRRKANKLPAAVIDGLAAYLGFDVADMVRIKDFEGNEAALKPIRFEGNQIQGKEDVPGVGAINWHIGVARQGQGSAKGPEMFALSRVCLLADFLARASGIQRATAYINACRTALEHPSVSGIINVPSLNKFVGDGRNEFGEELYENSELVLAVLKVIREKIVPEVERSIGLTSDQASTADGKALMRAVLEKIGIGSVKTGGRTSGDTGDAKLAVSPSALYLLPKTALEVSVKNPRAGATVRWDVKGGGKIERQEGFIALFRAGPSPCTAEILVTESMAGAESRTATVVATIVQEYPFEFEQATWAAQPNRQVVLSLRYPVRMKGKIAWRCLDDGTSLQRNGDPDSSGVETAVFSAGGIGTYAVEATAGGETIQCTVQVRNPTEPRAPTGSAYAVEFDGHTYDLDVTNFARSTESDSLAVSAYDGVPGTTKVLFNLNARLFDGMDAKARVQAIIQLLAGVIAEINVRKRMDASASLTGLATALRRETNLIACMLLAGQK